MSSLSAGRRQQRALVLVGRRCHPPVVRIELAQGDITACAVDAIVNAANRTLLGGRGVDGAIHRVGGPDILAECRVLRKTQFPAGLPVGDAVATTAGRLPARWVIHTVGPRFSNNAQKPDLLRSCYTSSLAVADAKGARTIAFPLISAGAYGWPKGDALRQAHQAMTAASTEVEVATLVLYDEATHDLASQIFRDDHV